MAIDHDRIALLGIFDTKCILSSSPVGNLFVIKGGRFLMRKLRGVSDGLTRWPE